LSSTTVSRLDHACGTMSHAFVIRHDELRSIEREPKTESKSAANLSSPAVVAAKV
jgi:hypothetical protein